MQVAGLFFDLGLQTENGMALALAWHWHGTALHFLAAGFFGSPGVDIRLRS